MLGTTSSPYLFFWQASSVVEEMTAAGLRARAQRRGTSIVELGAPRLDIVIGTAFSQVVMRAIMVTDAAALHAHGSVDVQTAPAAAGARTPLLGRFAFITPIRVRFTPP